MRHAFSLTETLVAMTVAAILFAMLLGVTVTQARLSASTGNYADMNSQNRTALTLFDNDMRAATSVVTMEPTRVVANIVTAVDSGGSITTSVVEYKYDTAAKTVSRICGKETKTLVSGVESGGFVYFNKDDQVLAAARTLEVKKIMLNLKLKRGSRITNTDYVVSAIVVMRSRPVG